MDVDHDTTGEEVGGFISLQTMGGGVDLEIGDKTVFG